MADILESTTKYRIKQIEIAEAEYYQQLTKVLDKIEDDIASLANKMLPTTDGKLINLQAAIAIRPQIKSILEKNYLPFADRVVRKGFGEQALRVEKAFKAIGLIPPEFQELTKGDLALIKNLKQQYFTQFKDISNTFTRTLSEKVYQNTLLGSEFTELEKELRQSINGIYSSSNDPQMNKLVDYIKRNKDDVSKATLVDRAVKTLQTKFGADRAGNNMKRYAGQLLNDSLRDFDATLNFNKAKDAGLTYVKYYGDIIPTTRQICRSLVSGSLNKRKNGLFTIDEVKSMWASRSWSGKKSGNPLVVRGGYNCRHQWSFVNPDWYEDDGEVLKTKPLVPTPKAKKPTISKTTIATSLLKPIKIKNMKIEKTATIQKNLQTQISKNAKDKRYPNYTVFGKTVPLSRYNTKNVGKVNLGKMSDKASSMVNTVMKELDELAVKYNVPKIRSITASRRMRYIASMGEGNLSVNPKYFENVLNKSVKTNMMLQKGEEYLANFKIGDDVSKEIYKLPTRMTYEQYQKAKATWKRPHNAFHYFPDELDKVRNIMYHEFGHQIHQMKFIDKPEVVADFLKEKYGFIPPIEVKLGNIKIARTGSTRYSNKNTKEWFAENFSLYAMDRKDLVDPNFIKFFEKEVLK